MLSTLQYVPTAVPVMANLCVQARTRIYYFSFSYIITTAVEQYSSGSARIAYFVRSIFYFDLGVVYPSAIICVCQPFLSSP